MRTRLSILFLFLAAGMASGVDLITRTIVITNAPIGNTNAITLVLSARTFTNLVTSSPGTLIQETNSIPWSASNILDHFTDYPVSGFHVVSGGTNFFRVRGAVGENFALSINTCCWGYVTNSTQTVASPTAIVRVPLTVEFDTNRTRIASQLVQGLSDNSTNAYATNSTAISNALIKGVSPLQTVISPVRFDGRTAVSSNFFATNGFTKSLTNINSVSSNHVNYGNAIRSEGVGGNSLQVGSNALARGDFSVAIGNSAIASNSTTLAIGTGAIATNNYAMAIGNSAIAGGVDSFAVGRAASAVPYASMAIGQGAEAQSAFDTAFGNGAEASGGNSISIGGGSSTGATNSVAIGPTSSATGTNSGAFGFLASATHSNAFAIGASAVTTGTNQILLGTSTVWIQSPGIFAGNSHTNTTFTGTNVLNGRVDATPRSNSGLANGYNSGVIFGTNFHIRFSGPSGAYTNVGFAAPGGPQMVWASFDNPGISFTLLNESGLDAVAANRIITETGALLNSTNRVVHAGFLYDMTASRWRVISFR